MSDDTPTQRFPEQGGDAPTERLAFGPADTDPATAPQVIVDDLQEERKRSRGLLIGLLIAGGLLLIAIIVLVVLLVRAAGEPTGPAGLPTPTTSDTASPEPTETSTPAPEPTETEAPPPPPPATPSIDSWKVSPATVYCNTQAPNPSNQYLAFAWSTTNADHVDIGIVDENGYQLMYYDVADDGTQQSIGQDIIYLCPRAQMVWRLTIFDDGVEHSHRDVVVTNNGDQQ